jgi:hypothetical protein
MYSKNAEQLKPLFWDYQVSEDILQQILNDNIQNYSGIDKAKIFTRLLESYSWYRIVQIIGKKNIPEILSDTFIMSIWNQSLRARYQNAKRFLHP